METKGFIQSYLEKMKNIEVILLSFLEDTEKEEDNFSKLIQILKDQNIHENKNELKLILHLISKISDNFHRTNKFFDKIERTLKIFQEDIKKFFSNFDVFNIFKKNKRVLLFLFEEKILIPDRAISYIITTKKYKQRFYPQYFYPEFKSIFSENFQKEIGQEISNIDSSLFEQKRKIGENDQQVCQLIKNDSLSDFVTFCEKENFHISNKIEDSIFETNHFLLKNKPTLIEYTAFCGSIQIFKHLLDKNADLQPNLWLYSIHSDNEELIHLVKEKVPEMSFKDSVRETIKCHNNKMLNYIKENCNKKEQPLNNYYFCQGLQFFNFIEFSEKISEELSDFLRFCHNDYKGGKAQSNIFYDFCKFDYAAIVDYFFKHHRGIINPDNVF